jgi:hypothetical protein
MNLEDERFDFLLRWRPIPIPDPIGPWLQVALHDEVITAEQALQLSRVQVQLQSRAIDIARQALDLQAEGLKAIGEAIGAEAQK